MPLGFSAVLATPHALTAGAKTSLMVIAGANAGLVVAEISVSFDGTSGSVAPALVELVSSTQATAGTPTDAATNLVQIRGRVTGGEIPQFAARYSAEPTVLTRIKAWYLTPNNGILVIQYPLGREPESDDSGGTIKGYGIRINVNANVNAMVSMEVEKNG